MATVMRRRLRATVAAGRVVADAAGRAPLQRAQFADLRAVAARFSFGVGSAAIRRPATTAFGHR